MRVDVGAGYRVYYYQQASVVYLLMMGGDKTTQRTDIAEAIKMKKRILEE
jgi:putative addiction module killer protein